MRVTFLGTGGAFPTAERNGAAHAVWVKGETLLFDCGEGTQRQLRRSRERFSAHRIFLSHLHLDHLLGVPGYLATMSLLKRKVPLRLYVPLGALPYARTLVGMAGPIDYEVEVEELDEGSVVQGEGFRVLAARVDHVGVSLAFRVQENERPGKVDVEKARARGIEPGPLLGRLLEEGSLSMGDRKVVREEIVGPRRPGRSIVYSGDTRPCAAMAALARGADLLVHEATFTSERAEEAAARAHSTSAEAASIACEAAVARLALTHISARHQERGETERLLREAREIFPAVTLPNDLDAIEIPLP